MRKRIRVDNQGLLIQSEKGDITRIDIEEPAMRKFERLQDADRSRYLKDQPVLKSFINWKGELDADVDVCIDWDAKCLTRPLRVYYGIEPHCDLFCSFCGPRKLDFGYWKNQEEKERFILREIAEAGSFQIQLTGGEIFLRAERLFGTIDYCRQLKLGVLLASNGRWSRIKNKNAFVKRLSEFNNILEVKISIDGDETFHDKVRGMHGSYRSALEAIELLKKNRLPVRINTTVFKESCETKYIEHIARIAKRFEVSLQAVPERSCGRSLGRGLPDLPSKAQLQRYTERARQLRDEMGINMSFNFDVIGGGRLLSAYDRERPFSCSAGLWGLALTHEGEVFPCGFAIEAGEHNHFCAGNIEKQGDLLDIWLNSLALYDWRYAVKDAKCRTCEHYKNTCWGGCKIQAFMMNGSLSKMDPYCFVP